MRRIGWWSLALQTLSLAMLAGLVTFALTRWLVGKPIERLRNLAQRIARGDFAAREMIEGEGEVAQLAREMNDMARQLDDARRALEERDVERSQASNSCVTQIVFALLGSWPRSSRMSSARRSM